MTNLHNSSLQRKNIDLSQKLNHMLKLEEIKWAPKSRQNWIQLGDKNNRFFFQTMTLNKRRKNKIWKIKDSDGLWSNNQEDVARIFINNFSKRFKFDNPSMIP